MKFHGKAAAGCKGAYRPRRQGPIQVKAIGATVERELGLVLGYLGRHAVEHLRGNIGGIARNERKLAHEALPHRRAQITLKHGDALSQAQSRYVFFRKCNCLGSNIAGQHARFRILESD